MIRQKMGRDIFMKLTIGGVAAIGSLVVGIPVIGSIILLIWLCTRGDDGPNRVQCHEQFSSILAVNEHSAERQHEQRRNRLEHEQHAQRCFRMGLLKHVPGDCGGVHSTADHGDHIGGKDEPQPAMLEDVTHVYSL